MFSNIRRLNIRMLRHLLVVTFKSSDFQKITPPYIYVRPDVPLVHSFVGISEIAWNYKIQHNSTHLNSHDVSNSVSSMGILSQE